MTARSLDIEGIKRLIPQREPFLFVDAVSDYGPDRLVAQRFVRADEPWFTGHFPGQPIFPGVLVLEAMVQTALLLLNLESDGQARHIFAGVQRLMLHRPVLPGEQLEIEALLVRKLAGMAQVRVSSSVRSDKVALTELSFGPLPG